MTNAKSSNSHPVEHERPSLSRRERQILDLLAQGLSGAQIAAELVLSPETVRTHVRNAMAKLGATTRSQAVVLALQENEIESAAVKSPGTSHTRSEPRSEPTSPETESALKKMLGGLVSLYDVDGGAVYLSEADGLSLRLVANTNGSGFDLPPIVSFGDGTLGRAALERRPQIFHDSLGPHRGALIAVPILGAGRLLGVVALGARVSRPVGRNELLLLQALTRRVGEVIVSGRDVEGQLDQAMDRFRTSWLATNPLA